ncbi:MAG: ABC transporter substrate-binding protein, partial [Methanosarcinaceae archaeon]|nr:ABC transporter substrate-binding protein [Methanosarcinaceae archaeon]
MFNKKINNLIICAMLMSIVFLMALYSIEEVQSVQVDERTITDANGNSVTINGTIDSIITLNTDAAEAVRLLGAEHKIIGISHHIQKDYRFFPMIHTKPVVSRWREPLNIEDILTVSRDYNNTILLTYSRWSPNPEDLEDKLIGREHNITIVRLDFYRPETLANEIKQLGIVLKCHPGTQDRATQYIEMHDNIVNQIRATVAEIPKNERPLVFTGSRPVGDLEWRAAGIGTSTYGLAEIAGANNIITDEGWHNIGLEFLIRERPEKVMLWGGMGGYGIDCTARLRDERFEPFINAPGMKTIPAVPYNVFVFDSDTGTSPAFFVTLAMLVEWWHPEKFDLCHLTIHQEYLDRFHPNLGFDVRKQGAFYYHRIPILN